MQFFLHYTRLSRRIHGGRVVLFALGSRHPPCGGTAGGIAAAIVFIGAQRYFQAPTQEQLSIDWGREHRCSAKKEGSAAVDNPQVSANGSRGRTPLIAPLPRGNRAVTRAQRQIEGKLAWNYYI